MKKYLPTVRYSAGETAVLNDNVISLMYGFDLGIQTFSILSYAEFVSSNKCGVQNYKLVDSPSDPQPLANQNIWLNENQLITTNTSTPSKYQTLYLEASTEHSTHKAFL